MSPVRLHRHPRSARPKSGEPRAKKALRGLVDQALQDVALVVSSRGLCAMEAARLAHLPQWDLLTVSAACQCPDCRSRRLH
jgi:hypothetical protein